MQGKDTVNKDSQDLPLNMGLRMPRDFSHSF